LKSGDGKMSEPLLSIQDLKTYFFTEDGIVKAVDGAYLEINRGEAVGLVGESGSGKSTLALSILRLVPNPPGRIVEGKVIFNSENLLDMSENDIREVRGKRISLIFQDPTSSLNPVFTIGDQVSEVITAHEIMENPQVRGMVIDALTKVGIGDARKRFSNWPHEFSAGMKQRAMIAMGLICQPDLLIADEPTSNLDVTVEAQILELMKKLKNDFGSSILLITHNLGIVARLCDRVAIMYAGKIMESADAVTIYKNPMHPYTQALLRSIPRVDVEQEELEVIPGMIPELINPPPGCRFHPRCKYATAVCREREPKLVEVEPGHLVSCLSIKELEPNL